MKPLDRRGRPLYGETWDRVYFYGSQLVALGYRESERKPNLFVRSYASVTFFGDLRGSSHIAPWEDPRPLLYWQFREATEPRRAGRMIAIEAVRTAPLPIRLTWRPTEETLEELREVDRRHFERIEPVNVPPALAPSGPRPRGQLMEALDRSTGELIPADADPPGKKLFCFCGQQVRRRWDLDSNRFYFDHPRGSCEFDGRSGPVI